VAYCTVAEVQNYLGRPATRGIDGLGNQTSYVRFEDDTIQLLINAGAAGLRGEFNNIEQDDALVKLMNILFVCTMLCTATNEKDRADIFWSMYLSLRQIYRSRKK
jgi:hypothetical protein